MQKKNILDIILASFIFAIFLTGGAIAFPIVVIRSEGLVSIHVDVILIALFMGAEACVWIALFRKMISLKRQDKNVNQIVLEISRRNLMIILILGAFISALAIIASVGLMDARFWYDVSWRAGNTLAFVLDACFVGFFAWTGAFLMYCMIFTMKRREHRISIDLRRALRAYIAVLLVLLASCGSIVGYALTFPQGQLPCDFHSNRGRGQGYLLPSGSHYNASLDSLPANKTLALHAIEKALQAWSCFEQYGGYPNEVDANYSRYWYDHLHWCPMNPNEISLAGGTQEVGEVYLAMYHLEPNPIYLKIARNAANAIINVQDPKSGAWWERAMFSAQGIGMQPDPNNPYHQCYYADGYLLSIVQFLLQMYDEEIHQKSFANATRIYDAIKRCMENLRDNRIPNGSWNKRSLAIPGSYGWGSVLNDGSTVNNIRILWLVSTHFKQNQSLAFSWAEEMARDVLDWLIKVQGSGGASYQAGWADQYSEAIYQFPLIYGPSRYTGLEGYDKNVPIGNVPNYPAWGRAFEPPAMSLRSTMEVLDLLFEIWLDTGESKYLAPFPAAISWFERPGMRASGVNPFDGINYTNAWYLYYELGTNVPIMGLNKGGPFTTPSYTYDLNTGRCCYGWFGFYANSTIDKYKEAAALNFSLNAERALWQSHQATGPYYGNATNFEPTMIHWVNALNSDGYWTINHTQYTIQDPAPYIIQIIRHYEFVYGTGLLMQFLRS